MLASTSSSALRSATLLRRTVASATSGPIASTSRVTLDQAAASAPSCSCVASSRAFSTGKAKEIEPASSSSASSTSASKARRSLSTTSASSPTAPIAPPVLPHPASPSAALPASAHNPYLPYTPLSTSRALSLLSAQSASASSAAGLPGSTGLYALASLKGRTYLLSAGDLLTVPRLKDVAPGDVLHLDRVHEVGSRDYTLRAQARLAGSGMRLGRMGAKERAQRDEASRTSGGVPCEPTLDEKDAALNKSIVAYQRGVPASLASQSSWLAPILASASASPSGANSTLSTSVMQTALDLSLRQNTSSFGALVSHPGGLAHRGAVLPALVGRRTAASTETEEQEGQEKAMVQVELTVVEHTKGKLERITKKKRRKDYKRTVENKQTYTRLRVDAIRVLV